MSIRFAIILPSQIYSDYRRILAKEAFASLLKTNMPSEVPTVYLLTKALDDVHPQCGHYPGLKIRNLCEPDQELGTESALAYGTDKALLDESVTHLVWMGDDSLFHPDWLIQLEALIGRHPGARAWSVYRSAYEAVHTPMALGNGDVRVKSLCGHGLTMTRGEWTDWGINWKDGRGRWGSPSGNTLDMLHIHARPGERWCTAKSYVQHTGREGKNCHTGIPEWAVDFQGGYTNAVDSEKDRHAL